MGQPSFLMRSYSYNDTRIHRQPDNQIKLMSDSLGCEKWSNVSKKCYVEEAKSYTQIGSVAEKKAFFDAYYKKLAAQKAAAAALLEQEKAAAADAHRVASKVADLAIDSNIVDADVNNFKVSKLLKSKTVLHRKDNIETPRTKNVTTNSYTDSRSLAPKSLKGLMNSSFVKESSGKTQSTKSISSARYTPKRGVTPMTTPAKAFVNGVTRRTETLARPTVVGSKSNGPKWHILSAVSKSLTTISSPFVLRTEDRAARRKQKLEEKFNEKQPKIVHQKARFKTYSN